MILMNSTVMKPLINSFFVASGILLDTLNLCFFHNVRDQVSLPKNQQVKLILFLSFFMK